MHSECYRLISTVIGTSCSNASSVEMPCPLLGLASSPWRAETALKEGEHSFFISSRPSPCRSRSHMLSDPVNELPHGQILKNCCPRLGVGIIGQARPKIPNLLCRKELGQGSQRLVRVRNVLDSYLSNSGRFRRYDGSRSVALG